MTPPHRSNLPAHDRLTESCSIHLETCMTQKTMLNAAILLSLACIVPAAHAEGDAAQVVLGASDDAPSWTLKPVR